MNMISELESVKSHYRSGEDDLGSDFFVPCLNQCSEYRRAAAYFSSSALVTWSQSLSNLIERESAKVKLLISPELQDRDVEALERALDEEERSKLRAQVASRFMDHALDLMDQGERVRWCLDLLTWMIVNGRLELRFAFPKGTGRRALFHEKIGIFDFPSGETVAFTGSANETTSGYHTNYESIDVYRSWVDADRKRVYTKVDQFEEAWVGIADGLKTELLSEETLERVRQMSPATRPASTSSSYDYPSGERNERKIEEPDTPKKWRHQDEAIDKFLEEEHGILEMATGTGKTRTSLRIMNQLLDGSNINSIVVATKGTPLLEQWRKTVDEWFRDRPIRIYRHYGGHHQISYFARSPQDGLLLVSRRQLPELFRHLEKSSMRDMLIVHDEVHGLGAPKMVEELEGEHESFGYTLGLTATPEREYDEEGNRFIKEEIGEVIYEFGLQDAIERGILCEFDYVPLKYDLTENDKKRLQGVFKQKAARKREGDPMSDEELYRKLAMVYKTAEEKPAVFREYISQNKNIIKSSVLFSATKDYGNRFINEIENFTHKYRTFYGEDDNKNLEYFSNDEIDILITCHKISEGIDVPGLESVILGSSDRARLETIQRIGRCLRTDPEKPDKTAKVVDFICVKNRDPQPELFDSDKDRMEWLQELSKAEQKE